MILYYIHDPMCSWCWAFKPILFQLEKKIPIGVDINYILGGLAKDSDIPMNDDMKQHIISNWKRIEKTVPNTKFNYDFWKKNIPKRSTYLSCRAILAADKQGTQKAFEMLTAIQESYYLKALDPSNIEILNNIAKEIGIDIVEFKKDIISEEINELLIKQINFSVSIGATSFPSLFLEKESIIYPIVLDYNNLDVILEHIESFI